MRLIKAKVSGYKRLASNCELNLLTDPVCIVGPNAAGKSSFLDALVHLNHDQPFAQTERTRIPGGQTLSPVVEARFLLEKDELELLRDIPEAAEVRHFFVIKKSDVEKRRYGANPSPSRDRSKREAMARRLGDLRKDNWVEQVQGIEQARDSSPDPLTTSLLTDSHDVASSDVENLEQRIEAFESLAGRLEEIDNELQERIERERAEMDYDGPPWPLFPEGVADLPRDLKELAADERVDNPIQKVINALWNHVPEFRKFDDNARKLEAEYDLTGEEPEPEAAIHNFLALAGTSWGQAVEVVQRGDKGWKKTYLDDMDQSLRERAALIWRQSDIEVKVDLDGSLLTILLSMQEHDFIDLEQHSDGLQQFMSLRAFVWRMDQEIKPIVLIDEADLHLHYDAQADLIGVFEEQQEAAKIIYTTHSAGCLPRDLGLGIRAIVPETKEVDGEIVQQDHSRTVDRFWTEGRGFSPLLLAMGAGAFAFSATQRAVITEGMSDALLLPSLIREATGERGLRYQAVPSFAEATSDEIARFDLMAGRIAFLTDGDDGGRDHVEKLTNNGILKEQILVLGGDFDSGLSIEDLLHEAVYLTAVNKELDAWHGLEFPAGELPSVGRSKAVEEWCKQQTGRNGGNVELSKVDVAQQVLDQRSPEQNLFIESHRQTLQELHQAINAVFEGAPERLKKLRRQASGAVVSTGPDGLS